MSIEKLVRCTSTRIESRSDQGWVNEVNYSSESTLVVHFVCLGVLGVGKLAIFASENFAERINWRSYSS